MYFTASPHQWQAGSGAVFWKNDPHWIVFSEYNQSKQNWVRTIIWVQLCFYLGGVVKIRLLLAALLLSYSLLGQSNRGAITGTVSDSTGSFVPGVQVVLINTDTGAKS